MSDGRAAELEEPNGRNSYSPVWRSQDNYSEHSELVWSRDWESQVLVCYHRSCIIPSAARATSSELWQKRKIPPPSILDGRVGRRSPSAARNTSGSYKLDARNARAVGLPSPRNRVEKPIVKQRALVVLFTYDRIVLTALLARNGLPELAGDMV